ncbi:hypothetical protein HELRODRAFT_108821 [Helobdella robusta]|uniref:Glycoprotein-N-acetylgalactosamine 3-beta-galactosyltransferase 1 n=1 Tax=Helobdella robusta TaxID=6412 RepID=T1EEM8_HELRO|nr:hypothetical protein HELRODRAFT_108821 [Helobdella robusta]ESO11535.1 hypothetical protein HELRODRAFT_108821 [Helobdella robusta]
MSKNTSRIMFDLKRKILILIFCGSIIIFIYQIALKYQLNLRSNSWYTGYYYQNSQDNDHQHYYGHRHDHGVSGGKGGVVKFEDGSHHSHDDTSVADKLKEKIKVLCWVMTSPDNHATKAVHILATWGKRCNKILFSTESNKDPNGLPLLVINTTSGRDHLTAKTMQTFDYLYRHHLNEFDWFLKADDDTYVVVENLRYFLSSQDPTEAIYFGHHFHMYMKQGYFSGGAGYTLSRAALKRFGERSSYVCKDDRGAEDVEIGLCMQSVGVATGDSRDALGRSRFHCFNPETHIQGSFPDWYYAYDKYGSKKGIETMSDYSISFHYIPVDQIYAFEFFLYHLRPYGIMSGLQELNIGPQKPSLQKTTVSNSVPKMDTVTSSSYGTSTLPPDLINAMGGGGDLEEDEYDKDEDGADEATTTTTMKMKLMRRRKRKTTNSAADGGGGGFQS